MKHLSLVSSHNDPGAGGPFVLLAPIGCNHLKLWLGHAASARRRIGMFGKAELDTILLEGGHVLAGHLVEVADLRLVVDTKRVDHVHNGCDAPSIFPTELDRQLAVTLYSLLTDDFHHARVAPILLPLGDGLWHFQREL